MTSGAPRVMVLVVILRGTRGDHLVAATDEVMHEFSSGDVLLQMSRAASNVMIAVVSLSLSLFFGGSVSIPRHFVLFDIFRSLLQLIVRASAKALRASKFF